MLNALVRHTCVAIVMATALGKAGAQAPPPTPPPVTTPENSASQLAEAENLIIDGPPELEGPLPKSGPPLEGDGDIMVVDWPMVLDLARASSLEIQLAQEKVGESHVMVKLAQLQWIPSLKVGTSYLSSTGRRQEIVGDIIEAAKGNLYTGGLLNATFDARKVCVDVLRARQQVQAKAGELDRVTRSEVQKVSNAYIDLVTAQAGAAISVEIAELIEDLVERSKQLRDQGFGTDVDVLRNEGALQNQTLQRDKAKQGHLEASTQLVMLLNLPPETRLAAAWDHLAPVSLVDENQPVDALVAQAQSQGPGMSEIASLLNSLDEQQRQIRRIALVPTVQAGTGYGMLGGGQGSFVGDFGDRVDFNVGAYWDVMQIVGTKHTRNLFNTKRRQANLEHEKLAGRLAAGVIIAQNRAVRAKGMIAAAEKQVDIAIRSYLLSKKRMDAAVTTSLEVLPAIASLGEARKNYLTAVIDYNKAQIELMYLLGQHTEGGHLDPGPRVPCRYVDGRRLETIEEVAESLSEEVPIPSQPNPLQEDVAEPVSQVQEESLVPTAEIPLDAAK